MVADLWAKLLNAYLQAAVMSVELLALPTSTSEQGG